MIADFDIEYQSLHREQLVQIIDSMDQRKMLGELPIGEYTVNSTKGINAFSLKVRLSPSKKVYIFFNKIPLQMVKNVFYFTVNAIFVLKTFKFLS